MSSRHARRKSGRSSRYNTKPRRSVAFAPAVSVTAFAEKDPANLVQSARRRASFSEKFQSADEAQVEPGDLLRPMKLPVPDLRRRRADVTHVPNAKPRDKTEFWSMVLPTLCPEFPNLAIGHILGMRAYARGVVERFEANCRKPLRVSAADFVWKTQIANVKELRRSIRKELERQLVEYRAAHTSRRGILQPPAAHGGSSGQRGSEAPDGSSINLTGQDLRTVEFLLKLQQLLPETIPKALEPQEWADLRDLQRQRAPAWLSKAIQEAEAEAAAQAEVAAQAQADATGGDDQDEVMTPVVLVNETPLIPSTRPIDAPHDQEPAQIHLFHAYDVCPPDAELPASLQSPTDLMCAVDADGQPVSLLARISPASRTLLPKLKTWTDRVVKAIRYLGPRVVAIMAGACVHLPTPACRQRLWGDRRKCTGQCAACPLDREEGICLACVPLLAVHKCASIIQAWHTVQELVLPVHVGLPQSQPRRNSGSTSAPNPRQSSPSAAEVMWVDAKAAKHKMGVFLGACCLLYAAADTVDSCLRKFGQALGAPLARDLFTPSAGDVGEEFTRQSTQIAQWFWANVTDESIENSDNRRTPSRVTDDVVILPVRCVPVNTPESPKKVHKKRAKTPTTAASSSTATEPLASPFVSRSQSQRGLTAKQRRRSVCGDDELQFLVTAKLADIFPSVTLDGPSMFEPAAMTPPVDDLLGTPTPATPGTPQAAASGSSEHRRRRRRLMGLMCAAFTAALYAGDCMVLPFGLFNGNFGSLGGTEADLGSSAASSALHGLPVFEPVAWAGINKSVGAEASPHSPWASFGGRTVPLHRGISDPNLNENSVSRRMFSWKLLQCTLPRVAHAHIDRTQTGELIHCLQDYFTTIADGHWRLMNMGKASPSLMAAQLGNPTAAAAMGVPLLMPRSAEQFQHSARHGLILSDQSVNESRKQGGVKRAPFTSTAQLADLQCTLLFWTLSGLARYNRRDVFRQRELWGASTRAFDQIHHSGSTTLAVSDSDSEFDERMERARHPGSVGERTPDWDGDQETPTTQLSPAGPSGTYMPGDGSSGEWDTDSDAGMSENEREPRHQRPGDLSMQLDMGHIATPAYRPVGASPVLPSLIPQHSAFDSHAVDGDDDGDGSTQPPHQVQKRFQNQCCSAALISSNQCADTTNPAVMRCQSGDSATRDSPTDMQTGSINQSLTSLRIAPVGQGTYGAAAHSSVQSTAQSPRVHTQTSSMLSPAEELGLHIRVASHQRSESMVRAGTYFCCDVGGLCSKIWGVWRCNHSNRGHCAHVRVRLTMSRIRSAWMVWIVWIVQMSCVAYAQDTRRSHRAPRRRAFLAKRAMHRQTQRIRARCPPSIHLRYPASAVSAKTRRNWAIHRIQTGLGAPVCLPASPHLAQPSSAGR